MLKLLAAPEHRRRAGLRPRRDPGRHRARRQHGQQEVRSPLVPNAGLRGCKADAWNLGDLRQAGWRERGNLGGAAQRLLPGTRGCRTSLGKKLRAWANSPSPRWGEGRGEGVPPVADVVTPHPALWADLSPWERWKTCTTLPLRFLDG